MLRVLQRVSDALRHHVLVLLHKASHVVDNIPGAVLDQELWGIELAGLLYVSVLIVRQVGLLDPSEKVLVVAVVTQASLLVNERENRG